MYLAAMLLLCTDSNVFVMFGQQCGLDCVIITSAHDLVSYMANVLFNLASYMLNIKYDNHIDFITN